VTQAEPRPVLVVDLGAQYAQLIARRVRECNVYSEIVPHDLSIRDLRGMRPAGIILSGGPASVYEDDAPSLDPRVFDLGVPVLGICYGHQLMAQALGGEVAATGQREYGRTTLAVDRPGVLLADMQTTEQVWMSHGDAVVREPDGFRVGAHTDVIPIAAMEDPERGLYAVQFHPEVTHTVQGRELLNRFVFEIAGARPDWVMTNYIEEAVARIREQVGGGRVICGLSGGVDSGVVAGTSAKLAGAGRSGGRWASTSSGNDVPLSRSSSTARAFAIVASIFWRLRTMPASPSSRSTSAGPNAATSSGSKPAKALRKASRLRRIVSHERPDWNPSRLTRSYRPRSSSTGRPHSSSW
jgi:GMP synthase (glutamine-hydrolysing) A subunit